MKQIISIDFYFENLKHIPLIDVSPGNLLKDTFQMPIILNFLMKNRQVVGTAYKKNPRKAIEIGFEYVNQTKRFCH
jgi:tRNA 2-selenouridine synthase